MAVLPSAKECERLIKPLLNKDRFYHSVCVSKEAKRLARLYGADEEKAEIAGMLHDVTKNMPESEQLKIIAASDIIVGNLAAELAGRKSRLWHAISGAVYVRDVLKIDDDEIFGAIMWHTSGRAEMTLLEKVIFVADFTSEDRDYKDVDKMRKLSNKSLEHAIVEGIRFTVDELMRLGDYVSADSIGAYNDAVRLIAKGKESKPIK